MDDRTPDPYDIISDSPPWSPEDDVDVDYYLDRAAEYEAEVIEEGIREQSEARAARYLSINGTAVWTRVEASLSNAEALHPQHPAPSIVTCGTGTELLVRYLLLRPLLAGLVFHDALAMRLIHDPFKNQQRLDRELLPIACKAWQIDLDNMVLPSGVYIWETLLELVRVRNWSVHRARAVTEAQALGAIHCTRGLVDQLFIPLTERLRLQWPPDGWNWRGQTRDPVESDFEYMGS